MMDSDRIANEFLTKVRLASLRKGVETASLRPALNGKSAEASIVKVSDAVYLHATGILAGTYLADGKYTWMFYAISVTALTYVYLKWRLKRKAYRLDAYLFGPEANLVRTEGHALAAIVMLLKEQGCLTEKQRNAMQKMAKKTHESWSDKSITADEAIEEYREMQIGALSVLLDDQLTKMLSAFGLKSQMDEALSQPVNSRESAVREVLERNSEAVYAVAGLLPDFTPGEYTAESVVKAKNRAELLKSMLNAEGE